MIALAVATTELWDVIIILLTAGFALRRIKIVLPCANQKVLLLRRGVTAGPSLKNN